MAAPNLPNGTNPPPDSRSVLFVDIDNCLYPRSYAIHDLMGALIDEYFITHLSLSRADATHLHQRYYQDYGLAIEGLVRHHKIDPLDYNAAVDDALPLDEIIKPNPALRALLDRVDREKVKLWLFTNAYVTHGKRVVRLLGVEDCFEGITYCDYGAEKLFCKPAEEMFEKAMREAGVGERARCYFVDDSGINAAGGKAFGWKTAHLVEPASNPPEKPVADFQISSLQELPDVFPELFKPS